MAFDEHHAQIMRDALADLEGITERRMFGGLCFMLNGNMLCGVHQDGGMARVGKENETEALEVEGVKPLSFTGRKMGGIVEFDGDVLENDQRRDQVLDLAYDYVGAVPAK